MNAAPALTVRREIAASAEELFDAWLDPASLAVWMRPGDTQRADDGVQDIVRSLRVGGRGRDPHRRTKTVFPDLRLKISTCFCIEWLQAVTEGLTKCTTCCRQTDTVLGNVRGGESRA